MNEETMTAEWGVSVSTGGFYLLSNKYRYVSAGAWPKDIVEISNAYKDTLLTGVNTGKKLAINNNGDVILTDPSNEEQAMTLAASIRTTRDELADRTSREINRLEDAGTDASDWRQYRIALRNVPEQDGFPFDVVWPEAPGDFTGK